jgi:hypothetical protein
MAVEQLTSGNDDGSNFGGSAEKISFFGGTAATQTTIAALASAATIATAVLQIQLIQADLTTKGLLG